MSTESPVSPSGRQIQHDDIPSSPCSSLNFTIPSPVVHKRNRTLSQSERAASAEHGRGTVEFFCRQKGHGFILPDDDGEFVPHKGDLVEYRKIKLPPKCEKYQAVHVKIVNLAPARHETWDQRPHLVDIPEKS